jgi:uncharacterized repeat protein (TIGR01451 family)
VTVGARTQSAADNDKKIRICHATASEDNPDVEQSPAIGNNGDLQGGHLDHPNDIIPPYPYVDADGQPQTYPGKNWGEEGQAIWENRCAPVAPAPEPITPLFECVERSGGQFVAHFGYDNPNGSSVAPPSNANYFSPDPADRGQPSSFAPGRHDSAFGATFTGGSITWNLTGNAVSVDESSARCQGTITVVKNLVPGTDAGRFDLELDGVVKASAVGDGGTTGSVPVDAGSHTVSESGADGTKLADYAVSIRCTGAGNDVSREGTSIEVSVPRGGNVVCTVTNQAKELPRPKAVTPVLDCVLFKEGQPDVAYWGYANTSGEAVRIDVGAKNMFAPDPKNRNQPTVFEEGTYHGVVQTPFDGTLAWTLSGTTVTASADSPACNPTIEVRKVTVPAADPGVFRLRINDTVVATGGNGTTSGPLRTGIGEGSVSEIAGPGTSLADYDSKVECTRNGVAAVSAPGTKVDGAVAAGDVVVCTFTNTRKGTPPEPTPPTPPTPPMPNPPPVPPPPPSPAPLLDLVVTKTVAPSVVTVGGRLTWTMKVTNRSSVEAADVNGVKVDDPRSFRTRLVSLETSQGTCRPYTCDLGRLAPGASATVTAVSEATEVGVVVDIVRVGSEEIESNYRNNVASAIARVIGSFRPPVTLPVCRTLTAAPRVLRSGRSSVVRLTARDRFGQPIRGLQVRARGAGVDERTRTDRRGIARFSMTPAELGLVHFTGDRARAAGPIRCRTLLGVLGAEDTVVTG